MQLSAPRRHVFFETDRPKRRRSFDELPRRIDSHPYDPTLTSSDLDLINLKCRRWTIGATSELAGVETLGEYVLLDSIVFMQRISIVSSFHSNFLSFRCADHANSSSTANV